MKQSILKTLTLTTFLGLIVVFVSYRSGLLDNTLLFSPNGSPVNPVPPDSTSKEDTLKKMEIMPSTKSMLLYEPHTFPDTAKQEKDSSLIIRREYMGGSKSIRMIRPSTEEPDSTKKKSE